MFLPLTQIFSNLWQASRRFSNYAKKFGLEKFTLRTLRYYFATLLADAHIPDIYTKNGWDIQKSTLHKLIIKMFFQNPKKKKYKIWPDFGII